MKDLITKASKIGKVAKVRKVTTRKHLKAREYGYEDLPSAKIGTARGKHAAGRAPVAKDTNKTRRPRALPFKGK